MKYLLTIAMIIGISFSSVSYSAEKPIQVNYTLLIAGTTCDIEPLIQGIVAGGEINFTNEEGDSVLMIAAKNECVDMVSDILDIPHVNVDHTNKVGMTALMNASAYCNNYREFQDTSNHENITAILNANADTTITSNDGNSAFTHAVKNQCWNNALSLVNHPSFDASKVHKSGRDALDYMLTMHELYGENSIIISIINKLQEKNTN